MSRLCAQPQPGSQWLLTVPILRLVVGLGGPWCPSGVMLPAPGAGKGCKKAPQSSVQEDRRGLGHCVGSSSETGDMDVTLASC